MGQEGKRWGPQCLCGQADLVLWGRAGHQGGPAVFTWFLFEPKGKVLLEESGTHLETFIRSPLMVCCRAAGLPWLCWAAALVPCGGTGAPLLLLLWGGCCGRVSRGRQLFRSQSPRVVPGRLFSWRPPLGQGTDFWGARRTLGQGASIPSTGSGTGTPTLCSPGTHCGVGVLLDPGICAARTPLLMGRSSSPTASGGWRSPAGCLTRVWRGGPFHDHEEKLLGSGNSFLPCDPLVVEKHMLNSDTFPHSPLAAGSSQGSSLGKGGGAQGGGPPCVLPASPPPALGPLFSCLPCHGMEGRQLRNCVLEVTQSL